MQSIYRLKKREDFNITYRFGRSMANRQFVVYYKKQDSIARFKLGISTSKKIGNSVVRNRMRRLVKEIIRQMADRIVDGVYIVIIVRKSATELNYHQLQKSVTHILRKSKLLKSF